MLAKDKEFENMYNQKLSLVANDRPEPTTNPTISSVKSDRDWFDSNKKKPNYKYKLEILMYGIIFTPVHYNPIDNIFYIKNNMRNIKHIGNGDGIIWRYVSESLNGHEISKVSIDDVPNCIFEEWQC